MVTRRLAWTVALIGAFTMTVSQVDRTTMAVLAPSVTKALGISETEYGWLASAFSIAYLVAVPLAGWWIDRIGARRGLVGSVLLWSGVAALHALVPSFGALFVLRIALGAAEGPGFPGAAQTMYRILPPAERARGFGVVFAGSSIGGMLAAPLASSLFDLAGWRVAFLGTSLFGLLWVPLWLVATDRSAVRAQLDARPVPLAPSGKPASFMVLLAHPLMVRALLAILSVAPVVGFGAVWGAKYLVRMYGIKQGEVGHYMWLPPVALDLGALLFGDLAARIARKAGAPPRLLLGIAAVLAAMLGLLPWVDSPWHGMVVVGLGTLGGGAVYTLVTADLLARMPPESVSFAGGILSGAQSLALIIASPLIGWSIGASAGYDIAATALAAAVVPGTLLWILWPPSLREVGEPRIAAARIVR